MAISFADSTGALFNRLGKLGLLIKQARTYQTSQLTNFVDTTNGVVAQYNAESDIQAMAGGAYIGVLNSMSGVGSLCQSMAAVTVNRMVYRDNPQQNQTLQNSNTLASLLEVIKQMEAASASVLAMTVSGSVTSFTGTGNGVVNFSTKRPSDGRTLENAFGEKVTFTCTSDSYTGRAVEGNESFSLRGVGNQTDYFAFDWPLGSNARVNVNAIDGSTSAASGNLLTNSGFDTWSSGSPSNWTVVTGTAGVDYSQESTIIFGGTSSLKLTGDGATETCFKQKFNDGTNGTTSEIDETTQYSVCLFLRRGGTPVSDGVLTVDLIDGGDNVLQDEAGVSNSFTIDLTGLTTEFAAYKGVFRTKAVLPSTVYVRLKLTTPITSGVDVYVDVMSMGEMQQLYRSGPFFAVHSGGEPFVVGDYAECTITNGRGSGGTLDTFQTLMARLFPNEVYGNELLLPSSDTPTISDGLIG